MGKEQKEVSIADEIYKYKQLLDEGIITQYEFDVAKSQLLGTEVPNPPQEQSDINYEENNMPRTDTIYHDVAESGNNEFTSSPTKSKKTSKFIRAVIIFWMIAAFVVIVAIAIAMNNRNEKPAPTPTPERVVTTQTPAPTPEPTPDPNFIHIIDYIEMWLKNSDYIDKRIQITGFVNGNEIEVKTDGEVLGIIKLRQPIEFIEHIDEEENQDTDNGEGAEPTITDDDNGEEDKELDPIIISGIYVTVIGRVSKTPFEDDDISEDSETLIIFLDEVIAEEATEKEIEQIYAREDERIAERVAREEREEAERIAREEREEAERLAPKIIEFDSDHVDVRVGKTHRLKTIITPKENNAELTYTVTPSSLASVDEKGVLTALSRGSGVVTVTTQNGVSSTCSLRIEERSPVTLRDLKYSTDLLGGVEWRVRFRNNSDKEIKYVSVKWDCYNAVGDKIVCSISRSSEVAFRFTGPLKAGATSSTKRTTTGFYNSTYSSSKFTLITVEFSDGTSVTLDEYFYDITS